MNGSWLISVAESLPFKLFLIRDIRQFPDRFGNDIDIMVERTSNLYSLINALRNRPETTVLSLKISFPISNIRLLVRDQDEELHPITIDVFENFSYLFFNYAVKSEIFDRSRLVSKNLYIISYTDEVVTGAFHHILYSRQIRKYKYLRGLILFLMGQKKYFKSYVRYRLSRSLNKKITLFCYIFLLLRFGPCFKFISIFWRKFRYRREQVFPTTVATSQNINAQDVLFRQLLILDRRAHQIKLEGEKVKVTGMSNHPIFAERINKELPFKEIQLLDASANDIRQYLSKCRWRGIPVCINRELASFLQVDQIGNDFIKCKSLADLPQAIAENNQRL